MSLTKESEEVSFSLRPGGGAGFNPFAQFGKGAGLTLPSINLEGSGDGNSLEKMGMKTGQKRKEVTHKYTKRFLMKFKERYSSPPTQVLNVQAEIWLLESDKVDQDEDNWRKDNSGAGAGGQSNIVTAAELGQQAWAPSKSTGMDQTLKLIRGLLNKLTPEKYDSLLLKFIDCIDGVESLSKAIPLIFEKAVAEPTFVALYAQLCQDLAAQLPEFPAAEEGDKPVRFQKLLLNTCQDEYEGVEESRQKLKKLSEEDEIALATTKLKQKLLGTMRLIAELHNKGLVTDIIMKVCMKDLLDGAYAKGKVNEENVEALCEVLTLAGKTMDQSKNLKKQLAAWLNNMDKMTTYDEMPPRLKFLIKDVQELKKNGWVARKQKFTAKKINEIREAAQAELGITDMQFNDSYLQPLPGQQTADQELFPGFKDSTPAPRQPPTPQQKPIQKPAVKQPEKPAEKPVELTEEERKQKTDSLLAEYVGVADREEAIHCINEIKQPAFMPRIVELTVKKLLDVIQSREQDLLMDLMMELVSSSIVTPNQFIEGFRRHSDSLMDLSLDVPKAPQLLAKALALVLSTNKISLSILSECCIPMEDTQTQRDFTAGVLKELISISGESTVKQKLGADGVKANEFLAVNTEFDPLDMPSTEEFLKEVGLVGILVP